MKKIALLLVDFQNDYFESGLCPLENITAAANNAAELLAYFRARQWPIVFIRHEFKSEAASFFKPNSPGAQIAESLTPLSDEPVILKHDVNSFLHTNLDQLLREQKISELVVCGAMSHMCIDAAVRAAHDLDYDCIVAHDACATKTMTFNDFQVPAHHVHAAYMAALKSSYAQVMSRTDVLSLLSNKD